MICFNICKLALFELSSKPRSFDLEKLCCAIANPRMKFYMNIM